MLRDRGEQLREQESIPIHWFILQTAATAELGWLNAGAWSRGQGGIELLEPLPAASRGPVAGG